jgi:hypothetical protein
VSSQLPVPDVEERLANLERAVVTVAAWLVQLGPFAASDSDAIRRILAGEEDLDGTPGTGYEPRA